MFQFCIGFSNKDSDNILRCTRYIGFSLSEVLIALVIIGVVASLTIPSLMNYFQDEQFKTAYKKAFSDVSNAVREANVNYELESNTGSVNTGTNFLTIMSKLKIQKTCTSGNNSECWDASGEKYGNSFGGRPLTAAYASIDISGRAFSMMDGPTSAARYILVDTNGFKKPNQWGKDRFLLILKSDTGDELNGVPTKVVPQSDNNHNPCDGNKCATENNYFGTSWLYK